MEDILVPLGFFAMIAAIVIVPAEGEEDIYSDTAFVTGPGLKCEKFVREGEVETL